MNRKSTENPAPTDLELMLYADGELTGERLVAVEATLAEDEAARHKLLGLDLVGGLLREQALESAARADDLTDRIMASIEAAPSVVVAPEDAPAKAAAVVPKRRRPANDNARSLVAIAAVALAAAAALLFWGRPALVGDPGLVATVGRDAAPTAPEPREDPAKADGDVEHGVEVAAVDFGARTGAVFYVPSGLAASSTTTVVWLSDDASGGDE